MEDVYCEKHDFYYTSDDQCPVCEGISLVKNEIRPIIFKAFTDGMGVDLEDPRFPVRIFAADLLQRLEDI